MTTYAKQNKYDLLSKFETVNDFNNQFEQAMIELKKYFTKSEYIALNKLRKFAYDENDESTVGVAWCKIQKAVAGTHQDNLFGISRSTFERMLRKARKFNLVRVINQAHKNSRQKHNVFVFNRVEEIILPNEKSEIVSKSHTIDVPNELKIDAPITNLLLELPVLKDLNKTYQQADSAAQNKNNVIDFEKQKTPRDNIADILKPFINDKKIANRIYGAWIGQTNKLINKPDFALATESLRVLTAEIKRREYYGLNNLNNPVGYFAGILKNKLDKWQEEELLRYQEDWEAAYEEDGHDLSEVETFVGEIEYNWLDEPEDINLNELLSNY